MEFRTLRLVVIGMGLMLIGGACLLAAAVWQKVTADTSLTPDQAQGCAPAPLDVPGRVTQLAQAADGNLLLLVEEGGAQAVLSVRPCSGALQYLLPLR